MSKELKDRYIAEYCEECTNPEKEKKYLRSSIFDVEELGGFLVKFDKPYLEKEFCFGYGQNGQSAAGDSRRAWDAARAVENNFNLFVEKNVEDYNQQIERLKAGNESRLVYLVVPCRHSTKMGYLDICNNDIDSLERFQRYAPGSKLLAAEDIPKAIKVIEAQKTNIIKRCETYWKKYGGSKLKTWAYLVD